MDDRIAEGAARYPTTDEPLPAVGRVEFRTGTKGRMVASVTRLGDMESSWLVTVGEHQTLETSFPTAVRLAFQRLHRRGAISAMLDAEES